MVADYLKLLFLKYQRMQRRFANITSKKVLSTLLLCVSLTGTLSLSACQKTPVDGPSGGLTLTTNKAASATIVAIAKTAQTCWFKSKDPAFKSFRLAAEVNSYAGRPRFLLVPKSNPGGLPKLVVQAEPKNGKTSVTAFGPMLSTTHGKRITTDIQRWATGSTSCNTTA